MEHRISTEEANFIAETCITVIRDRTISSLYGFECNRNGAMYGTKPSLCTILSHSAVEVLNETYKRYDIDLDDLTIYAGIGDLYSQLARLLIACRETSGLRPLVADANKRLSSMKICSEAYIKENHIRHLRNSVCQGNVKIQLDNNPLQSQIVFVDKRRNGTETARYSMNSEQLANVIEMILSEILLAFLNQIGWRIGSGE